MNIGAFGENFPYSNYHDLNMDWIIKIAKDFLDQYTTIQQTITTGLEGLDNKATELEGLLQAWYDTHSEDIADELASALSSLNDWYTLHKDYLDATLAENIDTFNSQADAKAESAIESIPSDYTTLYNQVQNIENEVENNFTFGNYDLDGSSSHTQSYVRASRWGSIPAPINCGRIKRIYFKSPFVSPTATRFFLGYIEDSKIHVTDTFIISTNSSKTVYENGSDFQLNKNIKEGTIIGFNLISGIEFYYGGAGTSYVIGQETLINHEYTYESPAYAIALQAECENILDQVNIENVYLKFGTKIAPNTQVFLDSDIIHAHVHLNTKTNSLLQLTRKQVGNAVPASRTDFINFSNGYMGFNTAYAGTGDPSSTYYYETCPFTLVEGHDYDVFSVKYKGIIEQLTLIDSMTQERYTISLANVDTDIGTGWGTRNVTAGAGLVLSYFDNYTLSELNNQITFIGDSYVEGNSLGANKDKTFAFLTLEDINRHGAIWGQGGANSTDATTWIQNIIKLSKSKYYIINIGMNDSNLSTWRANITSIIGVIENNGGTPILCTIPPTALSSNDVHMQINTYIRNSNYKYIDIAKIMSFGYDGTTINPDATLEDGIHPNIETHEKIYKLIMSSAPEIFGTAVTDE